MDRRCAYRSVRRAVIKETSRDGHEGKETVCVIGALIHASSHAHPGMADEAHGLTPRPISILLPRRWQLAQRSGSTSSSLPTPRRRGPRTSRSWSRSPLVHERVGADHPARQSPAPPTISASARLLPRASSSLDNLALQFASLDHINTRPGRLERRHLRQRLRGSAISGLIVFHTTDHAKATGIRRRSHQLIGHSGKTALCLRQDGLPEASFPRNSICSTTRANISPCTVPSTSERPTARTAGHQQARPTLGRISPPEYAMRWCSDRERQSRMAPRAFYRRPEGARRADSAAGRTIEDRLGISAVIGEERAGSPRQAL